MDTEVDHWKSISIDVTQKSNAKDFVIIALVSVVLILVLALTISMWGWFSTKRECSRTKNEIWRAIKFHGDKKSEEIINAFKGVCRATR